MLLLVSSSFLPLLSTILPGSPMDLTVLWRDTTLATTTLDTTTLTDTTLNTTNLTTTTLNTNTLTNTTSPSWSLERVLEEDFWLSYCSVIVFLTGTILARFGLWLVDLTINQLLQERVEEAHRGAINGVQESLNNCLDLAKCVLVILLPAEQTFGLLVAASFASVSLGWLLYALYSREQRGHLFHFQRLAASLPCIPHRGREGREGREGRAGGQGEDQGEEGESMVVKVGCEV